MNYFVFDSLLLFTVEINRIEMALQIFNINELLERLIKSPKTVCILVGSPGAGKSSLSKHLVSELNKECKEIGEIKAIHIEKDVVKTKFLEKIKLSMSLNLPKVILSQTEENLQYIFADATHPTSKGRQEIIDICKSNNWNYLILHIDVPIEKAQEQNLKRDKPIPIIALRSFYKKFREDPDNKQQNNNWITVKDYSL